MKKIPGSFRDPSGNVFNYQNKIIRSVTKIAEQKYLYIKNNNIIEDSIKNNFLINTFEINDVFLKEQLKSSFLLEHQKLEYVSYPYEWSFEQLRDAALHHLNYQIFLLEKNFELTDASAYNIQFIRSKPIFIDCLSLNKYEEGNPWFGHNQFCEQFLNPLLFSASTKVLFNNLYKGSLEGIKNNEIVEILKFGLKINPVVFFNILLPNLFDKFSKKKNISDLILNKNNKKKNNFNKNSYFWLIRSLKKFISNIKNPSTPTFWGRYNEEKTYSDINYSKKKEVVRDFIIKNKIKKVVDIGCNDGDFSELCLNNGAEHVVGLDYDQISLEKSYLRSKKKKLNFLPLYFDASNPSSNIGWYQNERYGFLERCNFDGLIALAFEHHLTIAKNIPLEELVKWFLDIAPLGLIEFVPKNDKTVGIMLSLKGDIFPDYTEENFSKILGRLSHIVSVTEVGDTGRKIYEYNKFR
jgi:ribosomal protein L11 methylase PrmA